MATSQYTDEQIVAGFIEAAGATRSMAARMESCSDALDRLLGELRSIRSYAAGVSVDKYAYSKICEQHIRLLEARQILQNLAEILE